MATIFQRCTAGDPEPGQYARRADLTLIVCRCGARLWLDLKVSGDGRVARSVACPACSFRDFIVLDDWGIP